jgi:hypothetical protein
MNRDRPQVPLDPRANSVAHKCFCVLHPDPGAPRHILVLAIAHDECYRENLPRLDAPQRDRGSYLAALAERMKQAVRLMSADLLMQPVKSRGH